MTVTQLDHLVLRVADVDRALAFYTEALGLTAERVDEWRAGTVPFPSVRITGETIIDLVVGEPSAALDHFCLVVDPGDADALLDNERLEFADRTPAERSGARGTGMSLYTHDPDGNTIELRWYPAD
ncbi:VOC family virulence protein [Flexivirga sp. ID2601S]|uniref:VOC family virulence protein n=1 Tax=Flexivirga aerilata TaxID=1656889 RepID=A0A849AJI5_9MICO|nr:VOC family protein [Flexivirga aerilata]NNG40994.1 VOC family virulence protein [Flexivirga aerilata]